MRSFFLSIYTLSSSFFFSKMRRRYSFSSSCIFLFWLSIFYCQTLMFYLLSWTSPTSFFFDYRSWTSSFSLSNFNYRAICFISSTRFLFSSIFQLQAVMAASLANSIYIFLLCWFSNSSYLSFSFISFFQFSYYDSSLILISKSFILLYSSSIFSFNFFYQRKMAATLSFMSTSAYFGIGLAVTFFQSYLTQILYTSSLILGRLVGLFVVQNSNSFFFLFQSQKFFMFSCIYFLRYFFSYYIDLRSLVVLGAGLALKPTSIFSNSGIIFGLGLVKLNSCTTVVFFLSFTSSILCIVLPILPSNFLPVAFQLTFPINSSHFSFLSTSFGINLFQRQSNSRCSCHAGNTVAVSCSKSKMNVNNTFILTWSWLRMIFLNSLQGNQSILKQMRQVKTAKNVPSFLRLVLPEKRVKMALFDILRNPRQRSQPQNTCFIKTRYVSSHLVWYRNCSACESGVILVQSKVSMSSIHFSISCEYFICFIIIVTTNKNTIVWISLHIFRLDMQSICQ